jgi:D-3-phosphoglycerate dehydrogenase
MKRERPYKIVVAEPLDPPALARLEEIGEVTLLEDSAPDKLLQAVGEADALVIRGKAHITARILDGAPRLKVIARASPTIDHIDLRAVNRRNIPIVYAPHVAVASTAEFTLALVLALHRRVVTLDRQMREGKYDSLRTPKGHELGGLTLGLLGLDGVAETLGRMCKAAFGMPLLYHDPAKRAPTEFTGEAVSLDALLQRADIVSVHLPNSPNYRGLLNAARLSKMKPTALLVNTSRGTVIDTHALAVALKKQQLGGAALDVHETEPPPMDHPIRTAPNCILTPHVAGATLDASLERNRVTDDVARVLRGEPPRFPYCIPESKQ